MNFESIDSKAIQTISIFVFLLAYISAATLGAYHNRYRKHLALCYIVLGVSACGFFVVGVKGIIETFRNTNNTSPRHLLRRPLSLRSTFENCRVNQQTATYLSRPPAVRQNEHPIRHSLRTRRTYTLLPLSLLHHQTHQDTEILAQ